MDALINLKDCKEYMTITFCNQEHQIKLAGTVDTPYFCGKDVCKVLGYKDIKDALKKHVDREDKLPLSEIKKVGGTAPPTFLGQTYAYLSHNDGRAVYISEGGLYSLIMSSEAPFAKDFRRLVCNVILPSIRKFGSYSIEQQLSSAMEQLALKDKSEQELQFQLKQEREEKENAYIKLRSETKRLKQQIKRTLEFNQATKQIEPLEYIYICTTEYYQQQHKFKVGGVQTFDLLKSRLTQYNSGESDSEAHFFIYIRKTVNYRSIEHAIKGLLSGFRENQSNELYIMHYDWLVKFVDAIMDGNAEFALLVNNNREQIAEDTINKEPTIVPPIQLEQIMYHRAGDNPRDLTSILDSETKRAIQDAIDSFEPYNNTVKRREFEEHLLKQSPNIKLEGKKRNAWDIARAMGSTKNPMWRYKY
ncbi:289L [Invertebrate iridescent virus Kaz2018]|uniref:Putative Bro-N domain-containing protein 289L n=1 Tax=Invertebrate iridescent virus 6 TaxID=176652 RepID=289L_IIV6|nr:289L [Invertebrate iridescent virus 6]Q91FN5.1 RecName: Full=Putative Bro-N domain-containing protein 289L [Invertebrate iridescent virus 6]AAK82150.1 289L [Invertebrate iridescent virus 6]QNH08699.1 289L [Invertebrate iridescent virus Kaz2018]